jgi:hypothetical protein
MALRIRRGTDAERQAVTFAEGELIYTTDTKLLYVGDGTTAGGILAGGGGSGIGGLEELIDDLSPQLGGDLDLNNQEIFGTGSIDITGSITADVISGGLFVGDGSGLTNLPGSGIVEGSNYRINILGSDSSIMIDTNNISISAAEINATDVNANDQFTVGNDTSSLRSSIFGNNSRGLHINSVIVNNENAGLLVLNRASTGSLDVPEAINDNSIIYSTVNQAHDGTDYITGSGMYFLVDGTVVPDSGIVPQKFSLIVSELDGNLLVTNGIHYRASQQIGIMTDDPQATLDINGNTIVRGNLQIETGSLILESTQQEVSLITEPVKGQVLYDSLSDSLFVFNGIEWRKLFTTDTEGSIEATEGLILGKFNNAALEIIGEDSSVIDGAVIYNTDQERVQFFQAGSWVNLINNGTSVGQLLSWNGLEWSAVDPVVTEGTIENANLLNGFSGSHYLDYNNFTNTPTIPSDLTDLGIIDGTAGQVLTTDGIGNFDFADVNGLKSRGSLAGSTGSIADNASANVNITGYKGYMLYKVATSAAAWVRLYISDAARTADASRTQGQDPLPGSGVIAEVITTGAETVIIAPGAIGFNNESPVTNVIPVAVTNLSGGAADITVTLTAVEMEA